MTGKRAAPKQQRAVETRAALLVGASRVFARASYSSARLKDIAAASGVSEGALFFHFGTKGDVARAILSVQQERMTTVLTECVAGPGSGMQKLFNVVRGLGKLMASDEVVQAGITLAGEPTGDLASAVTDPYVEWIRIARTLLQLGIEDGSIRGDIDVESTAQFANYAFVGAQVIGGIVDSWASLPARLEVVESQLARLLAAGPNALE